MGHYRNARGFLSSVAMYSAFHRRGPRLRGTGGRAERGQALVEFSLILPVALLLMAAILDVGRVFYAQVTLINAAREGAFQAARTPTAYISGQECSDATTASNRVICRVQLEGRGGPVTISASQISMTCGLSGCPASEGSTVTVGVSGHLDLVLFRLWTPDGRVLLGATYTAQVEYFPTPAPIAEPSSTPAADPTPGVCTVPSLVGQRKNDAQDVWSASGFVTQVEFGAGNGNYVIGQQSVVPGWSSACDAPVTVGP